MSSITQRLTEKKLITPPTFLRSNVMYETIMGSVAYGVSEDTSDVDIYGFCIPPKEEIFPHLAGHIPGFGNQKKRFEQFQQHHIQDTDKEYDVTIYNIVKYFQLCMENNPNMIDSLFTPQHCILHNTQVGTLVRENRKLFLHKGSWHKFKGYAYSQLSKAKNKKPEGNRVAIIQKYGWDVKFLYHVVRLIDEVEQILTLGDIDLTRNKEHLKAIRRGEVTIREVENWFQDKEKGLEKLYISSNLQYSPDQDKIKTLLLNCLEQHHGSLEQCITIQDNAAQSIQEIQEVLARRSL